MKTIATFFICNHIQSLSHLVDGFFCISTFYKNKIGNIEKTDGSVSYGETLKLENLSCTRQNPFWQKRWSSTSHEFPCCRVTVTESYAHRFLYQKHMLRTILLPVFGACAVCRWCETDWKQFHSICRHFMHVQKKSSSMCSIQWTARTFPRA